MKATYTIQMALLREDGRIESVALDGRADDSGGDANLLVITALLDQLQALMSAVIRARAQDAALI